jgi:ketosteroid isomerase-like protein
MQVYGRYEADAAQFVDGESDFEVLHFAAGDGVAYWVGIQRAGVRLKKDGQVDKRVSMNLRVTEVFRREGAEWKLVHRHADLLEEGKAGR